MSEQTGNNLYHVSCRHNKLGNEQKQEVGASSLSSGSGRGTDEKRKRAGYSSHISGVAWGLLIMGLSLAAIFGAWATIGVKGPEFSFKVMQEQQEKLRELYGLPPAPEVDPEMLEIPPSLRNITTNATDNSTQ